MRYTLTFGLIFLTAAGCADKSAPQESDLANQGGPQAAKSAPQESDLANQGGPQAAVRSDGLLSKGAVRDDKPIPQDVAEMEKRRAELLKWNLDTLVGAYDQVGKKDPAWDKHARAALDLAARMFSSQVDPLIHWVDIAKPAKAAIDAGSDDPLIVFFHSRSQPLSNDAEIRRFKKAAMEFAASRYPAWRRAAALMISVPGELQPGPEGDAFRREAQGAFDSALDLLPESVATDERNEFWERMWQDTCVQLIRTNRWLGMTGPEAYQKVDAGLAKIPELKALRLRFRGWFWLQYGWEARTQAFAPNVPAGGFQTLEECLTVAKAASEEAWSLQPGVAETAENLLEIDKAIGGDRATMELWFERAMKADGNDRTACWSKLDWLAPKWHGTAEEMLAFGRQCRDTKNWRTGITLLVADAHWRIAGMRGQDQIAYLKSPEVWADIQSVYDEYLKHHPEDDVARNKYATFCYLSAHYREAEEQYVALGDRIAQWSEFPYVPLNELKRNRERNARIVLGKEGRITFPGWHFVRGQDEECEWYVNIPAGAPHQEKPGILGAETSHVWNCSADGITYEIRLVKPPPDPQNKSPERVLDAARSVIAKQRGAEPSNLRDTLLAARPAQEFDVEAPGKNPMRLRIKTIVIGSWLFELSVAASKSDVTGKAANEFFNSFAYQPKAK
jgi:hypothetical protein